MRRIELMSMIQELGPVKERLLHWKRSAESNVIVKKFS